LFSEQANTLATAYYTTKQMEADKLQLNEHPVEIGKVEVTPLGWASLDTETVFDIKYNAKCDLTGTFWRIKVESVMYRINFVTEVCCGYSISKERY
jgi:hypothetical protein